MTDREEFAARVLQGMFAELAKAKEGILTLEAQIASLAKEFGVKIPEAS